MADIDRLAEVIAWALCLRLPRSQGRIADPLSPTVCSLIALRAATFKRGTLTTTARISVFHTGVCRQRELDSSIAVHSVLQKQGAGGVSSIPLLELRALDYDTWDKSPWPKINDAPLLLKLRLAVAGRHEPNQPASLSGLRDLGVLYWKLDADKYENDPKLEAIRKKRGYSYQV